MTSASLLSSFQTSLTAALKAEGLIPMSVGITKPTRVAENFSDVATDAIAQMDSATAQFGTRAFDRYGADANTYTASRFAMLASLESVSARSYPDAGGRSVGLGFHMDKEGARDVWDKAFGNTVSFDDVYAGKATLSSAQSKHLFDNDILYYEKVVDRALGGKPVTQNQRLALVSIAYNAPARIASLAPVLQNGSNADITAALLTQTFNPKNEAVDAIKQRRYVETSLFNGTADAATLMPSFADYYSAVQVDGAGAVKVQGRAVTATNTQMNITPAGAVAIPTDNLSALSYDNAGATRRLHVEANLETQIRASVTAVYGADYRVSIISGGQDETTGKTGSRRHDTMTAADVYIYDPLGKKLNAEQMTPLAQDWIARDIGSVGLPTNGSTQSMHLDLIGGSVPGSTPLGKKEGRFWFYGGEDAAARAALSGKVAPTKYALSPDAVTRGLVPPGSMPFVGSQLSTSPDAPIPAIKPASVQAKQNANIVAPIPATKTVGVAAKQAVAQIAANKAAALDPVQPVKPPVQGLRLPVAPKAPVAGLRLPVTPNSAAAAFPDNPAALMLDDYFGIDGRKREGKEVVVPPVVANAAIPGKSPLANGATVKVPATGTGAMGIPAPAVAAVRPVVRTTVTSAYVAPRTQPVYGVSATGERTDYGASPGQSTAGLKPGDRVYNSDTNSWELK